MSATLIRKSIQLPVMYGNNNEYIWVTSMYFLGIAHGPVVAGVIGATKPQYDIWGMTVNLASRMDSTGVSGKIQVPEATHNILADWGFVLELRGEIYIKGVSERTGHVRTYFISTKRQQLARNGIADRGKNGRRGRTTLAAVVFGLLQAIYREKQRGTNGGFTLPNNNFNNFKLWYETPS